MDEQIQRFLFNPTIGLITIVYSDKLGGLTVAFGVAGAGIAFAFLRDGWLSCLADFIKQVIGFNWA